jgi:hypothetical protein
VFKFLFFISVLAEPCFAIASKSDTAAKISLIHFFKPWLTTEESKMFIRANSAVKEEEFWLSGNNFYIRGLKCEAGLKFHFVNDKYFNISPAHYPSTSHCIFQGYKFISGTFEKTMSPISLNVYTGDVSSEIFENITFGNENKIKSAIFQATGISTLNFYQLGTAPNQLESINVLIRDETVFNKQKFKKGLRLMIEREDSNAKYSVTHAFTPKGEFYLINNIKCDFVEFKKEQPIFCNVGEDSSNGKLVFRKGFKIDFELSTKNSVQLKAVKVPANSSFNGKLYEKDTLIEASKLNH